MPHICFSLRDVAAPDYAKNARVALLTKNARGAECTQPICGMTS